MSDDLVRRLACPYPKDEDVEEVTLPVWVILLTTEAADRIEALEGQLKTVLDRETSILRYYDAKLDAVDAKLAKAVGVLEFAQSKISWEINPSNYDHDDVCDMNSDWCEIGAIVDATLAELKGEQP